MTRPFARLAAILLFLWPLQLMASPQVEALTKTLRLGELIEIMRSEGIEYGQDLEAELFPGSGGDRWAAVVTQIYDPQRMSALLFDRLEQELATAGGETAAMIEFFGSDIGQNILSLEITARRALLDDAVEEASKTALRDMQDRGDARFEALQEFAQINDLIESNVAGAMNSNYAFYKGLIEGQAMEFDMSESDIITDVWSQEDDIRADTEEWLFSYLAMAYQPLSDADLETYTEFSGTRPGQTLNRALFAAFDVMFTDISRQLGRSAAEMMSGQDI